MEKSIDDFDIKKMWVRLLFRFFIFAIILPVFLFLPAGSVRYWQAWIYYGLLCIYVLFVLTYLGTHDPALLLRRLRGREKDKIQRLIIKLLICIFFVGLILSGLDYRYRWSNVPVAVVIIANIFIFLGYLLTFLVFKENTYASRTIGIEEGQKVISTGPYAVIRHPMYAGAIIIYLSTPLALGSFWAVIFFVVTPLLIVFRLLQEEKMLRKELPGYVEYCQKTRYRLLPFIW